MKAHNLNDVRAILEKYYIDAVTLDGINPPKYRERQHIIWAIAEEVFGEEWASEMTGYVRKNYREGKYDE